MTLDLSSGLIVADDGSFVNAQHERIAQIIADYDPYLRLAWIPKPMPGDAQWAVVDTNPSAPSYVVFTSDVCDERLLARIFAGDLRKHPNLLASIESQEVARKAIQMQEEMDRLEEQRDMVAHVIRSNKSTYTANGKKYS